MPPMDGRRVYVKIAVISVVFTLFSALAIQLENPKFTRPIANTSVAVGREAILECVVQDLGVYKVAWLRVDTQTILTIQSHVITKNHRIGVTHSEHRTWHLHIKEVRESDKGWYMCQINTDPMKSQIGYLDVVVPPDIIDYQTSADMIIQEGSNVTLRCVAKGTPAPSIVWRRENGEAIHTDDPGTRVDGSLLNIHRVTRKQMGPYLCIASNGIPPSVSKRITLIVHFPPMIWIQYQLIGAYDSQQIVLECHSEAFPKSINYWTRDKGEIVPKNEKYEPILIHDTYKVHMKLIINRIEPSDCGIYKCISKNAIGETDGTINVYRIQKPAIFNKTMQLRRKKYYPDCLCMYSYEILLVFSGNMSNINDVTYQVGSSSNDRLGSLFLEEEKSIGVKEKYDIFLLFGWIIMYMIF